MCGGKVARAATGPLAKPASSGRPAGGVLRLNGPPPKERPGARRDPALQTREAVFAKRRVDHTRIVFEANGAAGPPAAETRQGGLRASVPGSGVGGVSGPAAREEIQQAQQRRDVMLRALWRDEQGAAAVEYGILVALIALAIVGSVMLVGENLNRVFQAVADVLGQVVGVRWEIVVK